MLVLGIDPGSRVAGYGLVSEIGGKLSAVGYGVVKPATSLKLSQRLEYLFREISQIVEEQKPDEVAVENIFFAKNPRSALVLGQARAAALLPGLIAKLPFHEYSALQVKKSVVGNGHAQKEQVAEMVRRLLGMKSAPKPLDVTDALAVAICHIHSAPALRKIAAVK